MRLSLLKPVIDRPGPWASVYANIPQSTEDAAKQQELTASATTAQLFALGADEATCGAVHEALLTWRGGESGAHAGRALFAAHGAVVLDTPLPGPPAFPFAAWGPVPRVTPLLAAIGDDPVCLVVRLDRAGADFAVLGQRGTEDAGQVSGADRPLHRTSSGDPSERHFQTKVENTWEHNAAEIADAVREAFEKSGAEAVLLVGEARERHSVHDKLPEPLRALTYESEHGGRAPGAESALVDRDIAHVRAVQEREHVAQVADRFRTGAGPGNKSAPHAAAGIPALVEAAREHRIDTLLVSPHGADIARHIWVGSDADQLAVRGTELTSLGEEHPVAARADDALVRSAAATGADVVVVRDPERAPSGGLGAILRGTEKPAPE
ncbi:Vms1/Ankzf1 family peptidyl-tRNA hydrolase [Streptomyces decoyicus]|uniref:Vms1/Ankzf1 family peptidyl-tRNA hydrolase n=1 Tax=Streptomyces decoyicus TaxID=249567 RepID=A0ABZ1FAM0_9ACTN|nr:Vms1/Ankzf1 family peptidyl-tRNA hydrolase [Streptomyces decoyicus]WSB67408.1 Vms1/Ankzf1 family peptidyl-tRNA hydrolase [Streptomyces decoyicus]